MLIKDQKFTEYRVGITRDKKGRVLREVWVDDQARIHRDDDKPAITDNGGGGTLTLEWYKHGREHRIGGPALLSYMSIEIRPPPDRPADVEHWKVDGEFHREGDEPAYIHRESDGIPVELRYYKNGELHRDNNKPAILKMFDKDGTAHFKKYYSHGRETAADGTFAPIDTSQRPKPK